MSSSRLEYLVPLAIILVVSMMLHEIAHGWVAYRMGDPTAKSHGRLSLNPLNHLDLYGTAMFVFTYLFAGFVFGWAKPVPISPYYFKNHQRAMALVGIAGPITNFCLAALFWVALRELQSTLIAQSGYVVGIGYVVAYNGSLQHAAAQILLLGLQLNIVLGLFNLIPIPPLDGSRILGAFLPRKQYLRWASLDQYGWVFIIAIILIVNVTSYGSFLDRGYSGLFHWLAPAYWG